MFAFRDSLNVVASKWNKRFLLYEDNFDNKQGHLKVDQPKKLLPTKLSNKIMSMCKMSY